MSHIRIAEKRNSCPEILVVDDEAFIRRRWKHVLERASFRVRVAADGRQALEEIHHHAPDLVILDLKMPELDGKEICRCLKGAQQTESIPVIMVTASDQSDDKIESLRHGANDYLTKKALEATRDEELVQRVRNALRLKHDNRDGNPLTGLPGNTRIDRELARRLEAGDPMAFLFIDIDHFKAYNDYYGYQRGDEAIRRTAKLITSVVWELAGADDFVGHVGGDDFVVMTKPDRSDRIARGLVDGFEAILETLFDPKEYEAGSFSVEGRTGKVERFRLMSLTIAVVTNESEPLRHPAQVNDRAMELKRYGKKRDGSFIARERRGSA